MLDESRRCDKCGGPMRLLFVDYSCDACATRGEALRRVEKAEDVFKKVDWNAAGRFAANPFAANPYTRPTKRSPLDSGTQWYPVTLGRGGTPYIHYAIGLSGLPLCELASAMAEQSAKFGHDLRAAAVVRGVATKLHKYMIWEPGVRRSVIVYDICRWSRTDANNYTITPWVAGYESGWHEDFPK